MKRRALKTVLYLVMVAGMAVIMTSCAKHSIDSPSLNDGGTQLTQEELAAQEAARRAEAQANERQRAIEEQRLKDEKMRQQHTEQEKISKARFENQDILFDYDSYELTLEAREILKEKAAWLTGHTSAAITIEGHCDERGTTEYNLALGEKRALAAKKYLNDLGVTPNRMRTISYGEEMPLVEGDDETSWAKNRRAHFVIR